MVKSSVNKKSTKISPSVSHSALSSKIHGSSSVEGENSIHGESIDGFETYTTHAATTVTPLMDRKPEMEPAAAATTSSTVEMIPNKKEKKTKVLRKEDRNDEEDHTSDDDDGEDSCDEFGDSKELNQSKVGKSHRVAPAGKGEGEKISKKNKIKVGDTSAKEEKEAEKRTVNEKERMQDAKDEIIVSRYVRRLIVYIMFSLNFLLRLRVTHFVVQYHADPSTTMVHSISRQCSI